MATPTAPDAESRKANAMTAFRWLVTAFLAVATIMAIVFTIAVFNRLLWWLVTDALAFLAIPFLFILRQILANNSQPFTADNEKRLRWLIGLSLAFACMDFLRPIASIAVQDATGFEGFEASWDFSSLFVALLLSALLEVWRQGVALQTEQELTI